MADEEREREREKFRSAASNLLHPRYYDEVSVIARAFLPV